ncbi:peptidoglycan editing factor PgeF [Chlamydiifrater phoenicopteri]|uniref:peptidoglycan editing factor PgeF n=1 Tax=Chlamydiifrater phoenicopteri TaxID=2681469 RepID=UPI001BCF3F2F|nr:peptidoglycan editing factor PgeF [Chlamydiifrater phoenicopteri]
MMCLQEKNGCRYFSVSKFKDLPIDIKIFPKQNRTPESAIQDSYASPNEMLLLSEGQSFKVLRQSHSTTIREAELIRYPFSEGDAMYASSPGISLFIKHSDCQATVFYDRKKHVVANVHCGWRGLVAGIYAVTVNTLRKRFHSDPMDLIVFIGPSLGLQASEFLSYRQIFPKYFQNFMAPGNLFDLKAIAKFQMRKLGIPESQIYVSDVCTYSSKEFFSYRRGCKENPCPSKKRGTPYPYRGNWTVVTLR